MWEPLLRQEIAHCSLLDSRIGLEKKTVFCLLDPPRHAVGETKYRRAQTHSKGIYQQLQRHRAPSLPVGLQDEIWTAFSSAARFPVRTTLPELALDQAGYGVAAALITADPRPEVLRLEQSAAVQRFGRLKGEAVALMEKAAPLLSEMTDAFDRIVRRVCSPRLSELREAAESYRRHDLPLSAYLAWLIAASEVAPVPVEVALASRIADLQASLDLSTLQGEMLRLEQDIRAKAGGNAINPRAALELYLYELSDRHGGDPDYQPGIETCRSLLQESPIPAVPASILEEISRSVTDPFGSYLVQGIAVKGSEMDRPRKGAGERCSRLLELGLLLDIDLQRYEGLKRYVYLENLHHDLQSLCDYTLGRSLSQVLAELEGDVGRGLATSQEDYRVLELEPAIRFMQELRQAHIGYGEESQDVLRTFRAETIWDELHALDPGIPVRWRIAARELDAGYETIIELNEETIRRGKLLARNLLARMTESSFDTAILVCDGYFNEILVDAFRAAEVSYSLLTPEL